MPLPPGPYETLITEEIDALLAALPPSAYATARLGPEWMEDALARHVGHLVLRHLRGIAAAGDAAGARVEAARAVLDALAGRVPEAVEPSARPAARGDALTWIAPPAVGPVAPAPPLLPLHGLVHPSFLFNGRTDVSLLGELVRSSPPPTRSTRWSRSSSGPVSGSCSTRSAGSGSGPAPTPCG